MRDVVRGLLDIVHAVEMRIVDAGKMNGRAAPLDPLMFVEQHPDAHLLERRHHADRVVIAEYAIDGTVELLVERADAGTRVGIGSKGLCPVIAGENADIVALPAQQLGHAVSGSLAHLYMHVADMEDGEAVEARGQGG